jgi:antitoxin ParD1/3/4
MSILLQRSVSLNQVQADFIDAKVATGAYNSTEDVLHAGLSALADSEARVESWLQTEVAQAFDESLLNPADVVSLSDAFAHVRAARQNRAAA